MSDTIITVKHSLVTVLYLNRPQTLNCFNNELLETLASTLKKLDEDPNVRCVVITGSGRGFCAGGDLGVLMDCDTQEKSDENMRVANEAVEVLFRMKTPTIAMVNGAAAGAGFNLALACDMIFATEKAKFIQSFVNVGIASDCGGHYLLEKAVGRHLAKELMFTARPVSAQEGKELGFVNRVYPPEQLQVRTQTWPAMLPAETAEKSFTVSDDLELSPGLPEIRKICCYETRPEVTDCKTAGGKAVFKGRLCIKALYLGTDDQMHVFEQQLPFSQYCDLTGDYEEAPLAVQMLVTGAELEPESSGSRKLLVSAALTAQCVVSRTVELHLTEDAYAVGGTLKPEWKAYSLPCRLDRLTLRDNLRVQMEADVATVLDCAVYTDFPFAERGDGVMRVKAPVTLKLLYLDPEGNLQGGTAKADAACETALSAEAQCTAAVTACEAYAQSAAEGADARAEVTFELTCSAVQELRTICGGTLELQTQRDPDCPSVVLRAAGSGQSVWDVARTYATTVQAVMEANHLEREELEPGQMLLIPI